MIGRAAYHDPSSVLCDADQRIFGTGSGTDPVSVARAMLPYIETHLHAGGRLNQITRHMLGLFAGQPGARAWRRTLSEGAHKKGAGPELVEAALGRITAFAADKETV
jgi:tRNA-dihydrouridine synthase A